MTDTRESTSPDAGAPGARRMDGGSDLDGPRPAEQRSALLRLVAVLAGLAAITIFTGTTKVVLVVVGLLLSIVLHEAGHFIMAKRGGMKATEFFVGFGPRLWSVRKGETEYGIKALPLGGYVKIIGMHNLDKIEDPADEPRTYRQQSFPRRFAVAVAGSTTHFIIAFVLFFVLFAVTGLPEASLRIGEISKLATGASPAEEAGFRVGDRVVSVDGRTFSKWEDLPPYIRSRPEQQLRFVVERDGRQVDLTATPLDLSKVGAPVDDRPTASEPTGFVGIGPATEMVRVNPLAALGRSARAEASGLALVGQSLAHVFSPTGIKEYWGVISGNGVAGQAADPEGGETRFMSPVGFVRVAGQAADAGLFEVLNLLIMINLFVGVFNLVPLLPFDGGHVMIAVYEAIRSKVTGRRHFLDVAKLMPITYPVFLVLAFLAVSSLYIDLVRPLSNPFQ